MDGMNEFEVKLINTNDFAVEFEVIQSNCA